MTETVAWAVPEAPAEQLAFDHPTTGARLSFASALPADLEAVLATLG